MPSCGLCCGGLGRALVGAGAIAFLGVAIGGVHSWLHPVVLRPDVSKTSVTVIPSGDNHHTPAEHTTPETPNHTPDPGPGNTQGSTPSSTDPQTPAPVTLGFEIKADQAKMLFDMGVPFIDAREPQFYEEGHIERAMNITADDVIAHAADLVRWRPGPIVVYCSGGDCDASHHVATRLQALQFTQIHIMVDGFPGWQEKGYPIVTGK